MNRSSFLGHMEMLFLLATVVLAVSSQLGWVSFKTEHTYVLLSVLPALAMTLHKFYSRELEKFSTVNVLAVGYVKNFLYPVIMRIINDQPGAVTPTFYIYIPRNLGGLEKDNLDMRIGSFKAPYTVLQEELRISAVLTKKIFKVTKAGSSRVFYIDFPATLLSLTALIEHKLRNEKNTNDDKQSLTEKYVKSFEDEVINKLTDINEALAERLGIANPQKDRRNSKLVFIRDMKEIDLS